MKTEKREDLLIFSLFVSVPLLCMLIFFLPFEVQNSLKARHDNLNPLTFITSVFVHADVVHLFANGATYLMIGVLVYVINKRAKRQRLFLYSFLLVVVLLPLLSHAFFIFLNNAILHLPFVSCGLSLIVSGLIGLIIPSLGALFDQEPNLKVNWPIFFIGSVFLTGSVVIFPYLDLELYDMTVFVLLTSMGIFLFARESLKILDFGRKGSKEDKKKASGIFLSLVVYFFFLMFLFPANIVQPSGNIVNIFAHFSGVFFGLLFGYFMLQYAHKLVPAHRRLLKKIGENVGKHYFMLLLIALSLFIIWNSLSLLSPNLENYTLRVISSSPDSASLFSTMGAILATILGIFFSISIIVVQHAASNYTPSVLGVYKRDYRTWFVFFYYLVNLAMTIFSLQYPTNVYLTNITVLTFIFSFLFLASQFVHIINLIDPRDIIKKAKQQSLKDIKRIPSRLESILEGKKAKSSFEESLAKLPIYSQFIFHREKTLLATSKEKVLQISDVILKASKRRELETCVVGLKALSEIVASYVTIRKDDSTTSDDFLQYVYGQLLAIFEIALDNKDASLLIEIITAFEEIGCSTTDIKSISIFGGPNQLTTSAIWNIHTLGAKAIENDFSDAAAAAILSLEKIGALAIQKTRGDGLASDKILEIGILGVHKGDWFIVGHAFEGLKELLFNAVSKRVGIHHEPSRILEYMEKLAELSIKKGLGRWPFTSLFHMLPEYSIQKVAWMAFQIKNEDYPEIQTHPREEYSKEVMSGLMKTLGKIATWASEKGSLILLGDSIDNILRITLSMLKEKFITFKEGYRDEILHVVDDLSRSYMLITTNLFKIGAHSSVPSEVSDAITSIAISGMDVEQKEVTTRCLEAFYRMCISVVERDHYGYDVARCAGRIGVIGAYALHKGADEIADKSADLLVNFDKSYLTKSPNPQDRLHIEEMRRLHRRFNTDYHGPPMRGEVYGDLFKKVSSRTLEKFADLYEKKRKIQMKRGRIKDKRT